MNDKQKKEIIFDFLDMANAGSPFPTNPIKRLVKLNTDPREWWMKLLSIIGLTLAVTAFVKGYITREWFSMVVGVCCVGFGFWDHLRNLKLKQKKAEYLERVFQVVTNQGKEIDLEEHRLKVSEFVASQKCVYI